MAKTPLQFELVLANCFANVYANPREVELQPGRFYFLLVGDRLIVGNLITHIDLLILTTYASAEEQRAARAELLSGNRQRFASLVSSATAMGHLVISARALSVDGWECTDCGVVTPPPLRRRLKAGLTRGFRQLDRVD